MLRDGLTFIGHRHSADCLCGCERVTGLPGEPVRDRDTRKLAKLGLVYMRFMVPQTNGSEREKIVCYDIAETYEQLALEAA